MNCKQGDLAIVVRSTADNEGKIVRCLRLDSDTEWFDRDLNRSNETAWIIDRALVNCFGYYVTRVPDSALRPIRPQSDDAVDTHSLRLKEPA